MAITLILIVLILLIAYYWLSKGAFSAMLHFACLLAAGAVAFAVWEPLSQFLVGAAPEKGFFSFLEGTAWTIGLLVPFAIAALLLRLAVDKLVPANLKLPGVADIVFGGVFGLASGVLATGIWLVGAGYARLPMGWGGYQAVYYPEDQGIGGGSLVHRAGVFPPVDEIVANTYEALSRGTLATTQPLGRWRPNTELAGMALRVSPENGGARNTLTPEDFSVDKRFRVGSPERPIAMRDLLRYGDAGTVQPYVDIQGEPVQQGYIEGFVLTFDAGAREQSGDVLFLPGMVHLVVENGKDAQTVFPVAVSSQARSDEADVYGRWRFDASEVFPASAGAAAKASAAYEFVVPQGYEPIALYVKNVRVRLDQLQTDDVAFGAPQLRDMAIQSGTLFQGTTSRVTDLDRTNAIRANPAENRTVRSDTSIGASFNAQNAGGLFLDESGRSPVVIGGDQTFFNAELNPRGTDQSLVVRNFDPGTGRVMFQVDVSPRSDASMAGDVVRTTPTDAAPILVDEQGVAYEAVGYVYDDGTRTRIRFTPGSPIRTRADLPSISQFSDERDLRLIFVVSEGVTITDYAVGEKVIIQLVPPIPARGRR